ncbi:MAG: N-acetylglucosamine kinase [Rubrobacteraceae bacterium]
MGRYLLVDGGQTGCRIVYSVDGEEVASGGGTGLSRQDRDRAQGLQDALERAFTGIEPRPDAVDVIVAGMTGFDGSSETARTLADGLRRLVRTGRVIVTNDAVTSYLGAVGFEPGVVVAAGTGLIALAADTNGNFARSDGWGYILGDDGGGYYVGRRGLASALRAHDGRGGSLDLKHRAEKLFGTPEQVKQHVYGASNPAGEVAGFAPQVAEAAREGDPVAREIWADAAREASLAATSALHRVLGPGSPATVSWTGNLFKARDLFLEPFKHHVAASWPAARLRDPRGEALHGAESLARIGQTSMFDSLTHVFEQ